MHNLKKNIKNARWLAWNLIVPVLAATATGQSVDNNVSARPSLRAPTNDYLVLSNVTGNVRVLDAKGLVLEQHLAFLPRIPLADLSPAQLQALLETKTAYDTLTSFGSLTGTNAQGAAVEHQFFQICSALSSRLASHGIIVAGVPPFYPIPPLTMKGEVDAVRTAN